MLQVSFHSIRRRGTCRLMPQLNIPVCLPAPPIRDTRLDRPASPYVSPRGSRGLLVAFVRVVVPREAGEGAPRPSATRPAAVRTRLCPSGGSCIAWLVYSLLETQVDVQEMVNGMHAAAVLKQNLNLYFPFGSARNTVGCTGNC